MNFTKMVAGFGHHTAVLSGPEIVGYVRTCEINHRGPAKMVTSPLPPQYGTVIFATMGAYDQASSGKFAFNRNT